MKGKRKWLVGLTALLAATILLISATIAYLTDSRKVTNLLGVGTDRDGLQSVLISLNEPSFVLEALIQQGAQTDDVEFLQGNMDEPIFVRRHNLLPGDYINKDPVVTNIGSNEIYLRFKIPGYRQNEITTTGTPAFLLASYFRLGVVAPDVSAGSNGFYFPTANNPEGYFYYVAPGTTQCVPLAPGDAVDLFNALDGRDMAPFRSTMQILPTMTNAQLLDIMTTLESYGMRDDATGAIKLDIVAEAIQAKHFNGAIPWVNEGTTTPVTIQEATER